MPRLQAPTPGTRIAVWAFPALTLWLGLGYLFGADERLDSPAFTAAKSVWSMNAWGAIFISVAAVKILCILRGRARPYLFAMCIGMGLYAWWAILFAAAFFADPHTSPGAAAWPLFVVACHAATLATMTERKRA